jgi:hypothetical protein
MKTKSIARLTNDAAALLQKLVRMKAADTDGIAQCVTCGVRKHWKELQGGHFISRVKTAHKLLEENIHPQCQRCNGPLRGNPIPYSLYMIDTYGREFVDELEMTKNNGIKYCRADLLTKIKELKAEIAECSTLD